jgi:hypothetical protein
MWIGSVQGTEAYLGKVNGYMVPATGSLKIGDKVTTKLMVSTGPSKVSVVFVNLQFDTSKLKVNSVVVNRNNFSGVYMESVANGIVSMYGTSSKPTSQLPSGEIEVATIELEAVGAGGASMSVKSYEVTGPSTSNDYSYQLAWTAPSFSISGAPTPTSVVGNGTDGVLKFRMSFAGVNTGAACSNNWPVSVTVMSGNENKTYNNIAVTEDGSDGVKKIYKGEVLLSGFSAKSNIAVFLKGNKHIQVKYGKSGQSEFYNMPGGTISIDSNPNNTPVIDLTKYPLTVGDITGESGKQDGVVDGLDFSFVKTEVNKRSEGDGLLADMNGNCKLESQDLTLLMLAMKDKQEQLY